MALNTNIVSYWKLDDANDSVGSNNLSGTAPSYTTGKIGNGGDFESGNSEYLNSPAFSGGTSWSFSCWLKPETNQTQNPISQDDGTTDRIFNLQLTTTDVVLYGWTSGGTLKQTAGGAHGMSTGTWYHWIGTWDSSGNMKLYKNGVLFQEVATTGNAKTTSEVLTLGRFNYGAGSQYYDGMIDEVGYWSRALTADEVSQIFNSGRGNAYPFTATPSLYGAVAYYKLDESSGDASDSVGSNTLTNNNTVAYSAGKINNGADFGTSNSNKYFNRDTDLGLTMSSGFSVSLWLKMRTEISSGVDCILGLSDANTGNSLQIAYQYNSGTRRLEFRGSRGGVSFYSAYHTITLGTSDWYHIACTYDGSTLTEYVNAVSTDNEAYSGTGSGYVSKFTVGASFNESTGGSISDYIDAYIDEMGVWSRALTSTEITRLYNASLALAYPWQDTSGFLAFFL